MEEALRSREARRDHQPDRRRRRRSPLERMTRLALCAFLLAALPLHAGLTPQELRGRQIYRTGQSPKGPPIAALVGTEDLELPATSLRCMSCHGRDGRGKQEGGVSPSNLQWASLTKPYSVPNASGRS